MKAITLCLATVAGVSALGTRIALTAEKVFGTTQENEPKIKAQIEQRKMEQGLGMYVEKNFTQKLDHFMNNDTRTFPMRYLVDDSNYNATHGPILFYAGNEGGITAFYNNSGFMTETLAKKWGAMVVFAEHRYYGTSMPFDNKT